ncbi:MAG: PAS domain S-box protein [Ignavibacteriae bacterium]|nr:MAG: PAS domain S-box protein [Ignavibacteriota bacterium]
MIIVDLIYNLSVLAALSVLSGFIDSRHDRKSASGKILQGVLFGAVAIIGMLYPFHFVKGIIFDGRSIVISLCTLFIGPLSGIISSVMAAAFRIYLGGGGALTGCLVVTASFLIGLIFYGKKAQGKFKSTRSDLYAFGFLVSAVMMALMLTLPAASIRQAYTVITATVMFFFPLITLLIGKVLLDQEENKGYLDKIKHEKLLYQTTLYSIGDAVITTDIEGAIRNMNPVAEQLTGWSEQEAIGKKFTEVFTIIDEDSRLNVENPVEKILHEGVFYTLTAHPLLVSRNGRTIPIGNSGAPIKNEDGEITGAVLVFHDQTEEHTARENLLASEANFRNLFQNSPVGKSITGIDGSLRVNKAFREMLGYSDEELRERTWMDVTFSEDVRQSTEIFQAFLDHKINEARYENRFVHKNGTLVWTDTSIFLQRDTEGNPQFFITTINDITERKRIEEALKEGEEIFRHFMENSPIYVFFKDENIRAIRLSKNYEQMLGRPLEELIGKTMDELFPSELAKSMIIDDKKILREKKPVVVEEELNGKYYTTIKFPILIDGRPRFLAGYTIDITERKHAEERLNLFSHTVKSINECVCITDLQKTILYANKAFLNTFGYSEPEIFGKSLEAINPGSGIPMEKIFASTVLGAWQGELVGRKKNGTEFPILLSTSVVLDDKGQPIALVGVATDISEQKKLQGQLLQAQKNQSIGTLAAGIAHDFNNILGIVLGYASMLERSAGNNKKISEYSRIITQAVNRGAALVRQILTFARKTDIILAPMNLNDLLNEIISMLSQTFPRVITFHKEVERDLPVIHADRMQIHQSLLNLFVNARDAMPNGGAITIKVEKLTKARVQEKFPSADQDFYVCLNVADTGEGMTDATRRQIFDPFFTTKEQGKGTGLGLAVVYGVIQSHHGFIDVESTLGHGSTFQLYFPVPLASEKIISVPIEAAAESVGGTEMVLLVEDEESLLEMVRLLLESKGYRVMTAQDGNEAFNMYGRYTHEIDIVLTDMGLPGMTGMDLFKNLKQITPNVQVLFASGFFEPDLKSELLKFGAKGFIQKPYSPDEVLRKLREALDTRP